MRAPLPVLSEDTGPLPGTPFAATGAAARPVATSIRFIGGHFAAAMCYLLAGSLGLLWIAPELAAGLYPSPHVAGITHLFTLGWLTTTIFGALYQIVPTALGAPIASWRAGHVSFWTFVPGVALFATGVMTNRIALHHAGIGLIAVGITLAVTNFARSLVRARTRDVIWSAMVVALSCLTLTFVLGVALLHNLHTGFLAGARLRVLGAHLHLALVGWAFTLIVGVSHRLLPMFLIARGVDSRWTRRALMLLPPGVLILVTGLVANVPLFMWLGAALLEGGVGCFVWQALLFYRARAQRPMDVGMKFAAVAIGFFCVAALLGPTLLATGPSHQRLATVYILVALLGGIVLYVIGHFYKIVPILAWTAHYRGRAGTGRVPTVTETFSARVAHLQLGLMMSGVLVMSGGIAIGSRDLVRTGAALWVMGVLLFASQIIRVATGEAGRRLARASAP